LQAATALSAEVTGMISNDGVFEWVQEFETAILDRFL
jgi:hypothetical protein